MVKPLAAALALLPMAAAVSWSQQQGELRLKASPAIPLYQITFKEGEPVKGVGAAPAFRLPIHCSGDGTVFITTVQPLRPDAPPPKDPLQLNPFLLISISPSGEAHSFPLNQVTDLYRLHLISEAPTDSNVVFLVSAAAEDRPEKDRDADPRYRRESAKGQPERHDYLVIFDRDGNYQKKIQLESAFRITHISPFSSGSFLVYRL